MCVDVAEGKKRQSSQHCVASNFSETLCKKKLYCLLPLLLPFIHKLIICFMLAYLLLSSGYSLPPSSVLLFLSLSPSFIYSLFLSCSAYIPLSVFSALLSYLICFLSFTPLSHHYPLLFFPPLFHNLHHRLTRKMK